VQLSDSNTLSFKSKAYLVEGFDKIISYVGSRRRTVRHFHSDAEINLTSCVGALGSKQVLLTQAPPEGHARKLERQVRTLRERMRAALHTLAYKLPLKLYQYLALYVVHNLNNLLNSLTARTPRELIDGIKPSLRHNARAAFGDLVMSLEIRERVPGGTGRVPDGCQKSAIRYYWQTSRYYWQTISTIHPHQVL